jgi:hypothetical protein
MLEFKLDGRKDGLYDLYVGQDGRWSFRFILGKTDEGRWMAFEGPRWATIPVSFPYRRNLVRFLVGACVRH